VTATTSRSGSRALLTAWLVLGSSLVGFYPVTGLVNPFWASLSGWPLYAAARGHPVYGPHPWYEFVAFIAGPSAMLLASLWLAPRLLDWRTPLIVA